MYAVRLFVSIVCVCAATSTVWAIDCHREGNTRVCRFGNIRIEGFSERAPLPVRLQDGDLSDLTVGAVQIPCFIAPDRKRAECILQKNGSETKHLYLSSQTEMLGKGRIGQILQRYLKSDSESRSGMFRPKAEKKKALAGIGWGGAVSVKRLPWSTVSKHQMLRGDIDGDGNEEVLVWRKQESREIGDFYRLELYRSDGTKLWESPSVTATEDRYAFGSWDFGESLPEALVDIDGDDQAELLVPAPASDVSPVYYRIFGWNGHALVPRRTAVLMCDRKDKSRLVWVNPYPGDGTRGCWVSRLKSDGSMHEAFAELTAMDSLGTRMGKAQIRFDPYGARLVRWIEPLRFVDRSAEKTVSNQYIARIGEKDHYNSRGRRLNDLQAILHQDRANYYRGWGDAEDTAIGAFDTPQKRDRIDRMPVEAVGFTLDALRKSVRFGTPLLRITVLPDRLRVEKIGD